MKPAPQRRRSAHPGKFALGVFLRALGLRPISAEPRTSRFHRAAVKGRPEKPNHNHAE